MFGRFFSLLQEIFTRYPALIFTRLGLLALSLGDLLTGLLFPKWLIGAARASNFRRMVYLALGRFGYSFCTATLSRLTFLTLRVTNEKMNLEHTDEFLRHTCSIPPEARRKRASMTGTTC